jgi:hypothetical protein
MLKNVYIKTFLLSTGVLATIILTAAIVPQFVGAAVTPDLTGSTNPQGYIYLSQVPYTGLGDFLKLMGFVVIVGLWSLLVVMVFKSDKVKAILAHMFRNVEEDTRLIPNAVSAGVVFDVSNNQMLNMNMSPVLDTMPEHFVHKQEYSNGNGNGRNHVNNVPESLPRDEQAFGMTAVSNSSADTVTDVNAFINLVVRGEVNSVFDYLRKMKAKGVDASDFATNVVLELDAAYRAKIDGDNNKHNIVLSQIISHWNRTKIEGVISSLLSIVDRSYSDPNLGLKVALMRMMRAV